MMIIDPVTLGDVSCTRASVKYAYDRTGTLVQVPANTLAVTYDPTDLTKAPYALLETASTNAVRNNTMQGAAAGSPGAVPTNWSIALDSGLSQQVVGTGTESGIDYIDIRIFGTPVANSSGIRFEATNGCSVSLGQQWALSAFLRMTAGSTSGCSVELNMQGRTSGLVTSSDSFATSPLSLSGASLASSRAQVSGSISDSSTAYLLPQVLIVYSAGAPLDFTLRIGLPQLEQGATATSPIRTTGAAVTRSADVIATDAGIAYSNVAITETAYSSSATYGQNALVYDPATYLMYQSLIASNTGKALSDTSSWVPTGNSVNKWQMFDQYNNTQTIQAEEVIVVVSPQSIAQGVYLGNMDASEVRVSVVDQVQGLVYQEVQSLIVSSSNSSAYNWCFKRIKKRSYAVSVLLPPFASGLVTIAIKKPGGTVKCGMCVVGALVDVGLAQYGLSREIKDYSTVNFNFDGTSNVVKRNYAKIMDVDVIIENDQIDTVIEELEGYRQKPLAWIGVAAYGSACLYGAYTSFKNVIQYPNESVMSLTIQGTV